MEMTSKEQQVRCFLQDKILIFGYLWSFNQLVGDSVRFAYLQKNRFAKPRVVFSSRYTFERPGLCKLHLCPR